MPKEYNQQINLKSLFAIMMVLSLIVGCGAGGSRLLVDAWSYWFRASDTAYGGAAFQWRGLGGLLAGTALALVFLILYSLRKK